MLSLETCWPSIQYASINWERDVFCDLHYDRFTYYPIHEQPRYQRDYVQRELTGSG